MLSALEIHATIPASDLERARRFYAEKLGLTPTRAMPGGLIYECRDSWFVLYLSPTAGSAQHTLAGWTVKDIEAEVAGLKSKGVVFEEYDTPIIKTIHGIGNIGPNKGAWFKDSEGNTLGLVQFA